MTEQFPNLTAFITDAVTRHTSEDAIRDLVDKNVGAIVKRSIDDAFRSYGDVGKQIEAAVVKALALPDDLDVPAYGHMVLAVVNAKLDEKLNDLLKGQISAQLDEMLSIAPPVLKLSDVVEAMREHRKSEAEWDHCSTFTAEVEEGSYSSTWIRLDCQKRETSSLYSSRPEKHFHEVRFLANTKEASSISALSIDKREVDSTYRLNHMPKWKRMIFAAYCCKTPFLIDATDFDTEIEEHGYDG